MGDKLDSIQIARYVVGLSWIYHGLFPKLFHIAPLEALMTKSIGFTETTSYWITKSAGVSEVIFGILFIVFYRTKLIVLLNIAGLIALLAFVAVLQPQLLVEAFNPVTTNMTLIALSIIMLNELKKENVDVEIQAS